MYQPSRKNHTLVVQLAEIWIKLNHMPPQVFTLQEDMESFAFPDRINLISTEPKVQQVVCSSFNWNHFKTPPCLAVLKGQGMKKSKRYFIPIK